MISAVNLTKYFDHTTAVDDVSFDVREGENLVLLGTSGCGKTTTLKMLNRLIAPSKGCVLINGKDIADQSPEILRRGIGYVLQHNSLFPHYTVADNIAVVPNLLKWDKKKIRDRTEELLTKLHMQPEKHLPAYPHELSGGQQQRVNIARALAADPPLLLMDEPFGALDAVTRASITKDFCELDELNRKTIVMVTHDVKEAFMLGDRICLMSNGRIVQQGSPGDLLFHPVSEFVRDFFAGSYLQLALGVIKVNDMWEKLVSSQDDKVKDSLAGDMSLWSAIEYALKLEPDSSLTFKNSSGQLKSVKRENLIKILSEIKSL